MYTVYCKQKKPGHFLILALASRFSKTPTNSLLINQTCTQMLHA